MPATSKERDRNAAGNEREVNQNPAESMWADIRIIATIGTPTTRLIGVLDALAHGLGAPRRLQRHFCNAYERRLMRPWA